MRIVERRRCTIWDGHKINHSVGNMNMQELAVITNGHFPPTCLPYAHNLAISMRQWQLAVTVNDWQRWWFFRILNVNGNIIIIHHLLLINWTKLLFQFHADGLKQQKNTHTFCFDFFFSSFVVLVKKMQPVWPYEKSNGRISTMPTDQHKQPATGRQNMHLNLNSNYDQIWEWPCSGQQTIAHAMEHIISSAVALQYVVLIIIFMTYHKTCLTILRRK